MQFDVTILGSNGAVAAYNRYPSSQIIHHHGQMYMVDCGEGAQFRMNTFGIKRSKLQRIFISHLHGDHYYGLLGLLTTYNLHWRQEELHIHGPAPLEEIISLNFKHSKTTLKYPLRFHATQAESQELIFEDELMTVYSFPLSHRLPTTGFLFSEKPHLRKILASKIEEYNIPYSEIKSIKQGGDFIIETGQLIQNAELTESANPPRSYAYCSDTAYTESILKSIHGVDLLYHEATFMNEHDFRATETFHTTTSQAAKMAELAQAKQLLIGHFSARYEDLNPLLTECQAIFPNTRLAEEGKTFSIG